MQNLTTVINWIAALAIGGLTFVVSRRVLKACPRLDNPLVAFCVAALTTLSLGGNGAIGTFLLPSATLGLALVFIFLLLPFLKDKKTKPPPESQPSCYKEDPWEKELRRRGKLSHKRSSR